MWWVCSTAAVAALSSDQVAALGTAAFGKLGSAQIGALSTAAIGALTRHRGGSPDRLAEGNADPVLCINRHQGAAATNPSSRYDPARLTSPDNSARRSREGGVM